MNTRKYIPQRTPNQAKRILEVSCAGLAVFFTLLTAAATIDGCVHRKEIRSYQTTQEFYEPRTLDNNRF